MELPEVKHLEDPQNQTNEPITRPWRMALRNSAVALLGIGVLMLGQFLEIRFSGYTLEIAWWMWGAALAFAIVICFTHAILAVWFGGKAAGNFLKIVVVLALGAVLFAVWWSLQSKNGV